VCGLGLSNPHLPTRPMQSLVDILRLQTEDSRKVSNETRRVVLDILFKSLNLQVGFANVIKYGPQALGLEHDSASSYFFKYIFFIFVIMFDMTSACTYRCPRNYRKYLFYFTSIVYKDHGSESALRLLLDL
jgi:hypothetical protein